MILIGEFALSNDLQNTLNKKNYVSYLARANKLAGAKSH